MNPYSFYADASTRAKLGSTAPEDDLWQSLDNHQRGAMGPLVAERKLLRQAGCQKFTTYNPGANGGTIKIKSGDRYHEEYFQQGSWVNLEHDWRDGKLTDVEFKHFAILGSWRWGARFFGVAGVRAENMTISGVQEEHGWYVNVSQTDTSEPALLWRRVLVENIGSQVLQVAMRPHETLDWEADTSIFTGAIQIEESVFRNFHLTSVNPNGTFSGGTRPAQTVQLKASPNNVNISATLWDNTAVPLSYGCLTVLGTNAKYGLNCSHRDVTLIDSAMYTAPSQQKPIWIKDCATFYMHNNHVESMGGKEPIIQLDNVGKIQIANCTGNVRIVVNGVDRGPISGGYQS